MPLHLLRSIGQIVVLPKIGGDQIVKVLLVIKKTTSCLHSFSCWFLLYPRRSDSTCKLAANKMLYNQNLIGIY